MTIGNSVTSISDSAFSGCSSLTSVTISDIAAWCNISFGDSYSYPLRYAHHLYLNGEEIKDLIIPNSVTSIGDYAFWGCSGLTSVTIPNSVTSIGRSAFQDCSGLTSVTIGNSVTSIGQSAFSGCSGLTSVTIPNSVTSIGQSAFSGCSGLTSVTIGNSVTSIGDYAFRGCSGLTNVTIPNSVTSIANGAFRGCSSLTSISVETGNTKYDSRNNCNAIIETASNKLIVGCKNTTIPNSVTSIGNYAFYGCSGLTSATIGNSVTSIGNDAFNGCSGLTSVTIGNSVTSIGDWAFINCSGLTSVTIPNSVTSIGRDAFIGTAWYDNQPDGLVYAGKVAYCYKGTMPANTSISLQEGTLGIAGRAFSGCSGLTSVTIPNSVTSIGDEAFRGCSGLTSATIGSSVTSIGQSAFYGCSGLTSVTIGNSVTSIGYNAFGGCSGLTSVTIGNSVTNIGFYAFNNCSSLTSVLIPNSVTSIAGGAFIGCSGLTSVTIPNSVTSIGDHAFQACSGLTSVTIGNSVASIGNDAFNGCSSLTSVTIPNSVTSIGEGAFSGTAWYDNQPDGLVYAGKVAYKYKGSMPANTSISLQEGTLGITEMAFIGCSGLTSVTIPNSVTSIGINAFYGTAWDENLPDGLVYAGKVAYKYKGTMPEKTSITLQEGTLGIAGDAFGGCSGLTSVSIPSSVTSIGDYAFGGCSGLTSVSIPSSVTSIGKFAFRDCSGLTSVTIPSSVTSIGDGAFNGSSGSVTVEMETPVSIEPRTFSNRENATLYVPYGCKAAYEATDFWKELFKEIVEMEPAGVEVTDISQMDNVIYIEPMEARTGTQAVISFKMKNAEKIHSFQFDLCLPKGVTPVKSSNGRIKGALSAGRLPEEDAYTLTFSEHDGGVIHFLCDSQYDDDIFTGNDGEIATLQVNIAETMADGDYAIVMKNMKLSEMDNDNYYQTESLSTRLSVLTYTPGDTNGDNSVTPADAIMILYYYFNVDQTGFNVKAADLNKDGAITPADAIEALYKYFNAGSNNARGARPAAVDVREPE